MINWTIGTAGTHANWKAALDALPAILLDNYTLTQISDVTETLNHLTPVALSGGFKVTFTSNKQHNGVEADAWITNINVATWSGMQAGNLYSTEFSNLWFKVNTPMNAARRPIRLVTVSGGAGNSVVHSIHDNVFELNSDSDGAIAASGSGGVDLVSRDIKIWNNLILDGKGGVGGEAITFQSLTNVLGYDKTIIENNTIRGNGTGIFSANTTNVEINKNVVIDTGASDVCFDFGATDSARNNASSDDTADDAPFGGGNKINIIEANEFESIVFGNSGFMKPLLTGNMSKGGCASEIPENTEGLDGNARPWSAPGHGSNNYSVGAFEYPSTPPSPPPDDPVTVDNIYADLLVHQAFPTGYLSQYNGGIRALLYSYGGELRVFETNKCFRYSADPKQGRNWSEYGGEGWIWPEAYVSGVKVFDNKDQPITIVMDALTGLFYRLASRDAPAGSGLSKLFKDKVGGEYSPGESIPWIVRLKEHVGNKEKNIVKHIESHIYLRPEEETNQGAAGYDANGYMNGQEITIKAYENGEVAETAKTENIPYKGDVVFDKDIENNRIQIEVSGTESAIKLVGVETAYELRDQRGAPDQRFMEEGDYQLEMCEPIHWLSRGESLTLDRATGDENISGSLFGSTDGPDGESNSAMFFSPASALEYTNTERINGNFTIQFAANDILATTEIVRFANDGIVSVIVSGGECSIRYEDSSGAYTQPMTWDGDGWVFVKISRSGGNIEFSEDGTRLSTHALNSLEVLTGNIQYLAGNTKQIFDIRIYDGEISDGAFAYYRDNVINNNGDAFLCY